MRILLLVLTLTALTACGTTSARSVPYYPGHYLAQDPSLVRVQLKNVPEHCAPLGAVSVWGDKPRRIDRAKIETANMGGNLFVLQDSDTGSMNGLAALCEPKR